MNWFLFTHTSHLAPVHTESQLPFIIVSCFIHVWKLRVTLIPECPKGIIKVVWEGISGLYKRVLLKINSSWVMLIPSVLFVSWLYSKGCDKKQKRTCWWARPDLIWGPQWLLMSFNYVYKIIVACGNIFSKVIKELFSLASPAIRHTWWWPFGWWNYHLPLLKPPLKPSYYLIHKTFRFE